MRVASDQARRNQIQQLQKRIANIAQEIERLQEEILTVERTNPARSKGLREIRLETYENLFQIVERRSKSSSKSVRTRSWKLQRGLSEEKMLDFT